MSRAEELAKRSRRISEILMSNGTVNTLRVIKYCIESETELRRLAQVEAEHAALKEELEAEREETKRWHNAAKWEQEIRKQAEMIADKAVTEHAALLKAISDAEPVAWVSRIGTPSVSWRQRDIGLLPDTTLLYTLNGIKKP